MPKDVKFIYKGTKSLIDSDSCFFDSHRQVLDPQFMMHLLIWNFSQNETVLNKELRKHGVTDLYVCGLCTDVCVGSIYVVRMQMTDITWKGSTLAHAQEFGYRTILIEDASRGINDERVQQILSELRQNNGIHVNSSEVNNC